MTCSRPQQTTPRRESNRGPLGGPKSDALPTAPARSTVYGIFAMVLKTTICDKVNVSNDQEMVQSDRKSHSINRVEKKLIANQVQIQRVELAAMLLLVATHPYLTKYTKHSCKKHCNLKQLKHNGSAALERTNYDLKQPGWTALNNLYCPYQNGFDCPMCCDILYAYLPFVCANY